MKIKWFGNSTFLLTSNNGNKILMDPFNIFNTFSENINVDFITCSKNIELNSFYTLNANTKIISSNSTFTNKYIKIKGYKSNADSLMGLKRGSNTIYVYELDNLKLCHLGYLGEMLNNEMINILKDCHIIFIPIGGNICIDGTMASKLISKFNPKYIFPMCYQYLYDNFYYSGPKDFLSHQKNVLTTKSSSIYIEDLKNTNNPQTILMSNSFI